MKQLPKDTNITTYFEYKNHIFSRTLIPDGRVLLKIEHCWEDGELMGFGFSYSDGISRKGLNPLHIVKLYDNDNWVIENQNKDLDAFIEKYFKQFETSSMPLNEDLL